MAATSHPFLDPTGAPTSAWGRSPRFAPDPRTKAQLRDEGLITGREVAGQLRWRSNRAGNVGGVRTANCYRRGLARSIRPLAVAA